MHHLVKKLQQRLTVLKKSRREAETAWQELAEFLQPEKARFFGSAADRDEERELVWSSVPEDALHQFAAGIHSLLTNPAQTWMHTALVGTGTDDLPKEVREWASNIAQIIMDACKHEESGFDATMNECYLDYGCFGQMGLFIDDPEDDSAIPFTSLSPHECFISENRYGTVDTLFRRLELTVRQVQERWGRRKRGLYSDVWQKRTFSDAVQRKIDQKQLEETVYVWQAIYPRKQGEWSDEATVPTAFRYASVFWEEETNQLLSEGGYREQPFMFARFSKFSGSAPWGRGAGHTALPHIRLLHSQEESKNAAVEIQCDPPLAVNSNMFKGGVNTGSGATNYYDGSNFTGERSSGIHPLPSTADVSGVHVLTKERAEEIRTIFFNDQLQMVGGPNMTAYEVAIRDSKKMMLLLPMWGRLATEFLPVFVERMNGILERRGDIPEQPEILKQMLEERVISRLKVAYVSPITMAQKASEAQTFQRAFEYLAPVINANPSVLDNFNLDEIARDTQDLFGYPAKYLKDTQQRDTERKQRAKQAQEAAQLEADKSMVETADKMGNVAGKADDISQALEQLGGAQ